jgi:hypothetical protein
MTNLLATLVLMGMVVMAITAAPNISQKLQNIDQRCTFLEKLAPPYIWGFSYGILGGDCSGQMRDIIREDKPEAKRTTAFRMWLGYGNWGTNNVEGSVAGFDEGNFPDLVFFNYQGKIASHVGMWRKKNKEEDEQTTKLKKETKVFAEASSSARYFKRTMIVKNDGRYKAILGTKKLDL